MTIFIVVLIICALCCMIAPLLFMQARKRDLPLDGADEITRLIEIVEGDPGDLDALWKLATLQRRNGNLEGAADALAALLARPDCPNRVEAVLLQVATLRDLGRIRESYAFLKDERDPRLVRTRAELAEDLGETQDAIAAWKTLALSETLTPRDEFHWAGLLAHNREFDESLPHFEIAYKAPDAGADVARAYAEALTAAGRHHDAWEIFRHLYAKSSNRDRILLAPEYVRALENVGNMKGALDVLKQAASMPEARGHEIADLVALEGEVLARMDLRGEAENAWRRALEIAPNHPRALMRLGVSGRPTTVAELLPFVRSLPPEHFLALFEMILREWGYSIDRAAGYDRDTLHFHVMRPEEGKDRRKLIWVKRWEDDVGEFQLHDLKSAMMRGGQECGVYITMTQFSAGAIIYAGREGNIELFAAAEIFSVIERIDLPFGG